MPERSPSATGVAPGARAEPSSFFVSQSQRIRDAAAIGPAVDLASGRGRHAVACGELQVPTVAVDRSRADLQQLIAHARSHALPLDAIQTDLESAAGIPLQSEAFGIALVFRFLFRPLMPEIERILRPGGILLYETFTTAQPALGWGPKRAAFLLKPGELPTLFPGLVVELADEGVRDGPRPEATARLLARKPA